MMHPLTHSLLVTLVLTAGAFADDLQKPAVRDVAAKAAGPDADVPASASPDASAASDASTARVDRIKQMQHDAITSQHADWGHWGDVPQRYSTWLSHSNRLIPIYTFGMTLDKLREEGSVYSDASRLKKLYGEVPVGSVVPNAPYFDQTDVYRLQQQAVAEGKTQVILIVFDGMDWESTYNAALYKNGRVAYTQGRGTGLVFQDYRGTRTDFGAFVTSPRLAKCKFDVNSQTVMGGDRSTTGGYDPTRGGDAPGVRAPQFSYPIGLDRSQPHTVTDSASSATSMTSGIKTYNAAINVDVEGRQVETIAHQLQRDRGFSIGVVTSVPVSHATPAAAYAHNVSRDDYQDITRDLIGLPSVSHKQDPLPGVDVLLGCGWGEAKAKDAKQGDNFVAGREFYDPEDFRRVAIENGGKYVVAQRTPGRKGIDVLTEAKQAAIDGKHRLLGVFGAVDGHLPFATADGGFDPALDVKGETKYSAEDVQENPVLADMAVAALDTLAHDEDGFWLMVEAGDVDWANHANNIDCSIGAVFSGDAAVKAIFDWVDARQAWDKTSVIVTSDHGHYFNLTKPQAIADANPAAPSH